MNPGPENAGRAGLPRRVALAGLALLLTPLLAVTALLLLLINLIDRLATRRAAPEPETAATAGGAASIIILNWNGRDLLAKCLPSVIEAVRHDGRPHEILVVDNGSGDGSVEFVRSAFPQARVLPLSRNLGFAHGNNAGVKAARHDVVVLLNNDMAVDRDFLRPLLDGFAPKTFAVASQIRFQDDDGIREETGRTSACFRRGYIDYAHLGFDERRLSRTCYPVFWAGGGSSAFHRERFLRLGGFDGIFSPAYVEDADLSFRAWRAGWEVLFAPGSIVYHGHRHTSSRAFSPRALQVLVERNRLLFQWKNLRSWPFLLSHCLFLPWNCYRLARDADLRIWRFLFQAVTRLPSVLRSRLRFPWRDKRREAEIFALSANPALFFANPQGDRRFQERSGSPARRVLWLTAYLPHPGKHAGAARMYQMLKRVSRDYRVTLLSFIEDEDERRFLPELESMCDEVKAIPRVPPWRWQLFPCEPFREFCTPAMERAFREALADRCYGLIQFEYAQMASYAQKALGIPTLLTVHEVDYAAWARRARVETHPLRKLRWAYNFLQVLDRERALVRRVDAAICVTDEDAAELRKYCDRVPVHVVNTGVDLDYFRPAETRPAGARLVYVGAYRHEPNVDAMVHFCRRILPLIRAEVPETGLTIVGSEPPQSITNLGAIPGVRVTGFVPDFRPHMAESTVYVVPLRLGAGIRGKVLEAWSMAMPVVATSVGCAGLRCRHGDNILVADSEREFARCVVSLLNDSALRERMGRAGRQAAEQHYGWDAVAAQLKHLYEVCARFPGDPS